MDLDYKIVNKLNEIGIALSKVGKIPVLLEKILLYAKELTQADGGTIYTITPDKKLHFEIAVSDSLNFHVGGTSAIPVPFPDLPLFLEEGACNDSLMVAYVANHKESINIKDAYNAQGFDFAGTKRFDATTGYRTRSVLTIPMKNHEDEVIAILQLINPTNGNEFSLEAQQLGESLASQAAMALTNQLLIANLKGLFESLIHVIAEAIDEKSPSTGNHSKRVPILAVYLAKAVNKEEGWPYKHIHFSDAELYEIEVAAFLHDCGKITTPVHVIEKRRKLETIFDRMEMVNARFDALAEKTEKEILQKKIQWFESHFPRDFSSAMTTFSQYEKELQEKLNQYKNDRAFLEHCNEGRNMDAATLERLRGIGRINYSGGLPMLTADELENLSIPHGNLTEKEREIVKHHVVMTYRMLSQLKFPKELKNVPEIASSHHERVDGKGYPRGLMKDQMLVQARILALVDVFEALSAPDRPYRAALPLSRVFKIMKEMVAEGHLDGDLFNLFFQAQVYLPYAKQYLFPEQLDI